jgi:hypothetical protein
MVTMRKRDELDGDDGRVARDRETIRVPMYLCDHQPGYRYVSDAAVRDARKAASEARAGYIQRLTDAWRQAGRVADAAEPDSGSRPEDDLLRRHLGSKTDPNAAREHERQIEHWKGKDLAELTRDVEERRRRNHAEFSQRLSNAWRAPAAPR